MSFIEQLIFNVVILGALAIFVYAITHGKTDKNKHQHSKLNYFLVIKVTTARMSWFFYLHMQATTH